MRWSRFRFYKLDAMPSPGILIEDLLYFSNMQMLERLDWNHLLQTDQFIVTLLIEF